jgi:hypothetical protein
MKSNKFLLDERIKEAVRKLTEEKMANNLLDKNMDRGTIGEYLEYEDTIPYSAVVEIESEL